MPMGPGIAGRLNFQFLKPCKKPGTAGTDFCGKIPAKNPGSPRVENNVEQQLGVVLVKKYERGLDFFKFLHVFDPFQDACITTCKSSVFRTYTYMYIVPTL